MLRAVLQVKIAKQKKQRQILMEQMEQNQARKQKQKQDWMSAEMAAEAKARRELAELARKHEEIHPERYRDEVAEDR